MAKNFEGGSVYGAVCLLRKTVITESSKSNQGRVLQLHRRCECPLCSTHRFAACGRLAVSRYHAVDVENAACGWTPLRVSRSSGGAVGRPLDYRFVGLRQIWQNRFNVCPLLGTRLVWGVRVFLQSWCFLLPCPR